MKRQFTASALIINKKRTHLLCIYHKKLKLWLQPGGHIEPNELPHLAAEREALEETGCTVRALNSGVDLSVSNLREKQIPTPYCMFEQLIPARPEEEEHMHIDLFFLCELLEAPLDLESQPCDIRWLSLDELQEIETSDAIRKIAGQILKRY